MTLTNEDIQQLIQALSERGISYQIPTEKSQLVKDYVIEESELAHMTDESHIKVGNSEEAIKDLPYLTYTNVQVYKGDSPSLVAKKLWQFAQARVVLGEVKKLGLPQSIVDEMQKQKPDNFSFMVGEEISPESPFTNFINKSPNVKGTLMRNYHYGDTGRDPDAMARVMLSFQNDAQQYWEFTLLTKIQETQMEGCVGKIDSNAKGSSPSYDKNNAPKWKVSNALQSGMRTASETRDKNIMIVSYWRVG